jgi:hypothetical protein
MRGTLGGWQAADQPHDRRASCSDTVPTFLRVVRRQARTLRVVGGGGSSRSYAHGLCGGGSLVYRLHSNFRSGNVMSPRGARR